MTVLTRMLRDRAGSTTSVRPAEKEPDQRLGQSQLGNTRQSAFATLSGRPAGAGGLLSRQNPAGSLVMQRPQLSGPFGSLIPILHYREFNLSFLGSGQTTSIVIANTIPISPYTFIGLSMRVHAVDIDSAGKFELVCYRVNPSAADGQDFVDTTTPLATSDAVGDSTAAGELIELSTAITNPQSPFMRVVLKGTGPTSGSNLYAVLSADLTAKTG